MPTKFQLITELYDQTVQNVTRSYESWTGFLRAACYNYKCPFDEQILIYAQRPDATAVLEMERWNRRFGRWVNRGAKSIAVFSDDGQNCLKLYFDVSDTHASRFARPLPIWTMQPAFEPEVIETLEATFGDLAEKENLVDAVRSACHNAVADNITDYLQDLCDNRQDSLLEELDDLNMEVFYRETLEVSVAYMLLTRLGLRADDYFSPDEFVHVYEFNTTPTINALGIAASDIAEMGLREISRTVMQAQRDQFFANRGKSGYVRFEGLSAGRFYLRELENEGYVPDAQEKTVYVKDGETTLVEWQNTPITGQVQVLKTSEDYNSMNGWPAGTPIPDTELEIYNARTNRLVDTIKADKNGLAVSKPLPLGRYKIVESKAGKFYGLDKTPIEVEIEYAGQIVKVSMTNRSLSTNVPPKRTPITTNTGRKKPVSRSCIP